jgi:hypothetical protein
MRIFAQAGFDDTGADWMLAVVLGIWPIHLHRALADNSAIGNGDKAAAIQVLILVFMLLSVPMALRLRGVPPIAKRLALPLGYPLAMFASNVLPTMFR